MSDDSKHEAAIVELTERVATIQAPTEEMKAFSAGLRVGYKKGFEAGYAQRATEEVEVMQPSEVLFNKPKIQ